MFGHRKSRIPRLSLSSDYFRLLLSRSGEDNNEHYEVKIQASELLLNNIEHTFVTPVFNGSTSLRDAAGQMIENVAKSVRRKETIDEAYMEKLFSDVSALYRLGQGSATASAGKQDLGPLPGTSKALLTVLGIAWAGIIAYYLKLRNAEKQK